METTSRTLYDSTAKLKQQVIRIPDERNRNLQFILLRFILSFPYLITGQLTEISLYEVCGVAKAKPLHTPYVIGGQSANFGEFPWFAAITKYQYNSNPQWKVVCGASLINSKYAITAAHCLHG